MNIIIIIIIIEDYCRCYSRAQYACKKYKVICTKTRRNEQYLVHNKTNIYIIWVALILTHNCQNLTWISSTLFPQSINFMPAVHLIIFLVKGFIISIYSINQEEFCSSLDGVKSKLYSIILFTLKILKSW